MQYLFCFKSNESNQIIALITITLIFLRQNSYTTSPVVMITATTAFTCEQSALS